MLHWCIAGGVAVPSGNGSLLDAVRCNSKMHKLQLWQSRLAGQSGETGFVYGIIINIAIVSSHPLPANGPCIRIYFT